MRFRVAGQANRDGDGMTAASASKAVPTASLHPNELDLRRIERALAKRKRYRYVTPEVHGDTDGYVIKSSCCSRNIDPEGGVIDIARIEYRPERRDWRLYHKDHQIGHWIMHGEFQNLAQVIELLNQDPRRRFWQ